MRTQLPHLKLPVPRRGTDRDRRLPPVDAKSEEAFRLVTTLYQALVSAESSERSLRDATNPDLAEFYRSVQKQQLGIAQQARSMLVGIGDDGFTMPDGHRTRVAG